MSGELVLVSGGSGFLGSHCIVSLLRQGFRVRTTVRSLSKSDAVRALVVAGGQVADAVEIVVAELTSDAGWAEAVAGCDYVLHVASPFPATSPKDPNELISPARDGAVRVLTFAAAAGVKRVVMTSSFAAIGYGVAPTDHVFTEDDWTDLAGPVPVAAYPTSKTVAERAAWEFAAAHPGFELAVTNPVLILGPPLGREAGTSLELMRRLVTGELPGIPDVTFGIVDVRDVADLHVLAMTSPDAVGERFLAVSGDAMSIGDMAHLLRGRLGPAASKIPTRRIPSWLLRAVGRFVPEIKTLADQLGQRKDATSAKAQRVLGWRPRTPEVTLVDTARALLAIAGR
jgi:nucleoside-diphosphate-sugar epimerase